MLYSCILIGFSQPPIELRNILNSPPKVSIPNILNIPNKVQGRKQRKTFHMAMFKKKKKGK